MEKRKIILIDDEPDFLNNVKEYFNMYDYMCLMASNGEEAMALIESEKPLLMILDILMPNMDGYTMLRELKKRNIDIPCIVMTGKEKLKDLFELEKVERFLTKPFELSKLKNIVDGIIEARLEENPALLSEKEEPKKDAEPSGSGKKKVLIIDDEVKFAESLKRFLELKGLEVYLAFSGVDGLEAVSAVKPDVICTDIMMPGLDGYSMTKELRRKEREIPIIVISGKDGMRDLIVMEGVDAFFPKPIDLIELEKKIDELLK